MVYEKKTRKRKKIILTYKILKCTDLNYTKKMKNDSSVNKLMTKNLNFRLTIFFLYNKNGFGM